MFSDNPGDKKMRRLLAGATIVGGTAIGINHLSNQRGAVPPPPPPATVDTSPSGLAVAAGEQKARMEAEMQGMDARQVQEYLYDELGKAASMRARGILEGESADLYYDFVPRLAAIADVLSKQDKETRESVFHRIDLRRKLLDENPTHMPAYNEQQLKYFAQSYEDPVQGEKAIAHHQQSNPDFTGLMHNELLSAYTIISEKIGPAKGRGG